MELVIQELNSFQLWKSKIFIEKEFLNLSEAPWERNI